MEESEGLVFGSFREAGELVHSQMTRRLRVAGGLSQERLQRQCKSGNDGALTRYRIWSSHLSGERASHSTPLGQEHTESDPGAMIEPRTARRSSGGPPPP